MILERDETCVIEVRAAQVQLLEARPGEDEAGAVSTDLLGEVRKGLARTFKEILHIDVDNRWAYFLGGMDHRL